MFEISSTTIRRIIIHRVYAKAEPQSIAAVEYAENITEFGIDEINKLKDRISKAIGKENRYFKLEIADCSDNSFFSLTISLKSVENEIFNEKTKSIADLLAVSHSRKTIPGGYLLIMDGFTENNKYFVLAIKAELQEAFQLNKDIQTNKNQIELIQDIFLSPAKDFYKIGLIVEDTNNLTYPNSSYSCYMYDDQFGSNRADLAEYFYSRFLGFTTDSNDKLLNLNFHKDTKDFINSNIHEPKEYKRLMFALTNLFEDNSSIINPQEFGAKYFENELNRLYNSEVLSKPTYIRPFTKDTTLIDKSLQKSELSLPKQCKLKGPSKVINEDVDVIRFQDKPDYDKLKFDMDSGLYDIIVTFKSNQNAIATN